MPELLIIACTIGALVAARDLLKTLGTLGRVREVRSRPARIPKQTIVLKSRGRGAAQG